MNRSLAIHSSRIYINNQLQPATIFIQNGKIQSVQNGKPAGPFEDLNNSVIMPGLIDAHVHINEPGRTDWEGFDTAAKAAAAGGITILADMPLNSSPVTVSQKSFQIKLEAAKDKLHVNCGFWGGIVPENTDKLDKLLKSGVLGIKAFLTHSGIDDFPNVTEADLRKGMPQIAKIGLPLLVHCELDSPHAGQVFFKKYPKSYRAWLNSRPKSWENEAIELMIRLCREYNCRVHIVHLSSAEALPKIIAAKEEGLPLTVETCPHYLFFNAEEIPDADTRYKCAPPIREKANNNLLWEALRNGTIDFVASDHSPAPPELKHLENGDLSKAWGGIAGLQFLLPATWTTARAKGFNLENVVNWLSVRPAEFIGMGGRKGKIAAGYDADLVVWNPDEEFVVEEKDIFHRHKVTPYLGQKLFGKVKRTYVGGVRVFGEGKMTTLCQGKAILSGRPLCESCVKA